MGKKTNRKIIQIINKYRKNKKLLVNAMNSAKKMSPHKIKTACSSYFFFNKRHPRKYFSLINLGINKLTNLCQNYAGIIPYN